MEWFTHHDLSDAATVHTGKAAVRIDRTGASEGTFSTITSFVPMDFTGTAVTLRGFLKLKDVSGYVGLWIREDGESGSLSFDNMQSQQVRGTREWAPYSVTIQLRPGGNRLYFGFLSSGAGTAWADDLELLVDGKPVWEAPKAPIQVTVLSQDHEFDAGPKIALTSLSDLQIANLTTLGKVWGFFESITIPLSSRDSATGIMTSSAYSPNPCCRIARSGQRHFERMDPRTGTHRPLPPLPDPGNY